MLTEPGGKIPVICGEKGLHGDYVVLIIYSDKEHSGEMLSNFPVCEHQREGAELLEHHMGGLFLQCSRSLDQTLGLHVSTLH